ncbi:putative ribonuclease H-like domain-containing protein [Tanacetum coccineum]
MKKMYCLVVTDDYSRFSWVLFVATKDETSGILKSFITGVENLIDQRVKVIRCDNGTEFKNKEMNQFYERKGKFDGKADEGFFVGDSINSKAFRSMNYKSVVARNQSNGNTGTKAYNDTGKARIETEIMKRSTNNANTASDENKTNNVNAVSSTINAASIEVNAVGTKISIELSDDPNMPELEDIVYLDDDENVGAEADMNNLNTFMPASLILTTRIHKDLKTRYFSFGRHLDELHMTWAHLEKKRTRLRTNTKTLEDLCSQSLEMASQAIHNAVTTHQVTVSQFS